MAETLSFEMDETIYSTLRAELSVETPFFTGKISQKLPRLINQWVTEEKGPRERLKPSRGHRGYSRRGCGKLDPTDDAGPDEIRKRLRNDGGLSEKAAAGLPRLINQWPSENKHKTAFSGDRKSVRRHRRISCMMRIEYEAPSGIHIDFVRNVSRSGAYLETRKGLSIGDPVVLMIPLLKGREIIRVKGAVVRKDEAGVGIAFKEIMSE